MCGASLVKGGRGNEGWKWVKSGGEMVQPPTIDRSSASNRPVDEQFVGKIKKRKKREKWRGKR